MMSDLLTVCDPIVKGSYWKDLFPIGFISGVQADRSDSQHQNFFPTIHTKRFLMRDLVGFRWSVEINQKWQFDAEHIGFTKKF